MKTVIIRLAALTALGVLVSGIAVAAPRPSGSSLARITFYSGDRDSGGPVASTGVRLVEGKHVAVDPAIIPYGSEVTIPGLGSYRAVDCGSAVTARTAARKSAGGDPRKANAIVIDVFVGKRETVHRMARTFPMFVEVSWRNQAKGTLERKATPASAGARRSSAPEPEAPPSKQTAQKKTPISLPSRG